ncbi:MAG: helix-hairpin-helix domain-containing protein [Candidatus Rokubacteria bacterium]|nr:helix-hairpin-helix domain-containing protein [Candidatus Rokubacteria bacterium]
MPFTPTPEERMTTNHCVRTIVLAVLALAPSAIGAATITRTETITAATAVAEKVNINTAGVRELMTLSGVGRKLAEKIVQYREAHGPFKKPEDVKSVEGVGSALWEQNRGRIVVK